MVPILFVKKNSSARSVIMYVCVESINYSNKLKILKCILLIPRLFFLLSSMECLVL